MKFIINIITVKTTLRLWSILNFFLSLSSVALFVIGIIKKANNEKKVVTEYTTCNKLPLELKIESINAKIPIIKINIKNLGNIFLKNLDVLTLSTVLKTVGATNTVWYKMTPNINPEKIKSFDVYLKNFMNFIKRKNIRTYSFYN